MPSDSKELNFEDERNTEEIPATINENMPDSNSLLEAASKESAQVYRLVPERLLQQDELNDKIICWRVELHNLDATAKPMGLDIIGDTIIGRGSSADVNLDEFSVFFSGVSRRHIALHPTEQDLYIIDLGSTNGTMVNNVPIPRNQPRPLASGTTITIGKFSILLIIKEKFVWDPSTMAGRPGLRTTRHIPTTKDDPTQPTINLSLGSDDDDS